jgi:hypothetical protein
MTVGGSSAVDEGVQVSGSTEEEKAHAQLMERLRARRQQRHTITKKQEKVPEAGVWQRCQVRIHYIVIYYTIVMYYM